jgi:hypothetical protein
MVATVTRQKYRVSDSPALDLRVKQRVLGCALSLQYNPSRVRFNIATLEQEKSWRPVGRELSRQRASRFPEPWGQPGA